MILFPKPRVILVFFDVILLGAVYYLTGLLSPGHAYFFLPALIFGGLYIIALHTAGAYNTIWGYATLSELLPVIYSGIAACTAGCLLSVFSASFSEHLFPDAARLIYFYILAVIAALTSRIIWYSLQRLNIQKKHSAKRILILGAGTAGVGLLNEFEQHPEFGTVIGFLDNDPGKIGRNIHGCPIFGRIDHVMEITAKHRIDEIIIAIPRASSREMRNFLRSIDIKKVRVRTLPAIFEILESKVSLGFIRDIEITDILGRKEVKVDLKSISAFLHNKKILVTGAGGSIGSEICRQAAAAEPAKLYILGRGENSIFEIKNELSERFPGLALADIICDITDYRRLEHFFHAHSFDIIFHAAAHKHVPLMEKNPSEAFRVNTIGTWRLARLAARDAATLIMISTDKAVRPSSIMGASKRLGELVIGSLAAISRANFAIVRFGNVLGSRGSVVNIFKEQI
ncbi:MAG TPA: polysaccharide biosynthesis protein, partial [Spirochaetia bacterium]|nr:polysaccharide biosynthesis protein [Spirochaetia bacterium]